MNNATNNNTWSFIGDKMNNLRMGLLRFQDKNGKKSFEVKSIKSDHPSSVSMTITQPEDPGKLINHPASLTQKSDNGYLYVTGLISGIGQNDMLMMTVLKAFWFVRKGSGKASWLEEACVYEQMGKAN